MKKIYDLCRNIIVISATVAVVSEWLMIIGFIILSFEDGLSIGMFGSIGIAVSMISIFVTGLISENIEKEMEEEEN